MNEKHVILAYLVAIASTKAIIHVRHGAILFLGWNFGRYYG